MADARYTIGLDFGTNSVRALLVDARTGEEIATSVWNYEHGDAGILLDPHDPDLARQNPDDYLTGIEKTVTAVMARARERGVLVSAFGPRTVRAVTHLDVSRAQCEQAASVLVELLG